MIYGYARVSTSDQKTDLQILALQEAGCEALFVETASGADRRRPELTKCLGKLQSGDVLVVWKLDRLGRSRTRSRGLIKQPFFRSDLRLGLSGCDRWAA